MRGARSAERHESAATAANLAELAVVAKAVEIRGIELAGVSKRAPAVPKDVQRLLANVALHKPLGLQRKAPLNVAVSLDADRKAAGRTSAPAAEQRRIGSAAKRSLVFGKVPDVVPDVNANAAALLGGNDEIGDVWQVLGCEMQLTVLCHTSDRSPELQSPDVDAKPGYDQL